MLSAASPNRDRRSSDITILGLAHVPHSRASPLPFSHNMPSGEGGMELHLERLRRDRERDLENNRRRRRSSRFSILSSTPTVVEPPSQTPPPFTPTAPPPPPARPSLKDVVRQHPRNIAYVSVLILLFIGAIVGWAVYLNVGPRSRGDGYRGGLVVNGLFVILLIIIFILAGRQIIFITRLFRPPTPNQSSTLPPWLVGRPPTYREALRSSGNRGTGDVEDGFIAQNESLPKYGEEMGSTLLARSQSRGGNAPQILGAVEERPAAHAESEAESVGSGPEEGHREGAVRGEAQLREEREHEMRQIAEARRLQNETMATTVDDAPGPRAEGVGKEAEEWEEVRLERKDTSQKR